MNRQQALIWIAIIFVTMFIIVLLDSANVTWDCTWTCYHWPGKVAFVVATLALIGFILVGLIRKKKMRIEVKTKTPVRDNDIR